MALGGAVSRRASSRGVAGRVGRQRGFTLIELSIVLVIIGILISIVAGILPDIVGSTHDREDQARLERAEKALIAYAARNRRLPCPDTDGDGRENRDGDEVCDAISGRLPFLDLGLSDGDDARGQRIAYGVYNQDEPLADLTGAEYDFANLGQFCMAIDNAAAFTDNNEQTDQLRVVSSVAGGPDPYNTAFAVVSRGRNNAFDANNEGILGGDGIVEHPRTTSGQLGDEDYEDQVRVVGFSQLAGELGCGRAMAEQGLIFLTRNLPDGEVNQGYEQRIYVEGGLPGSSGEAYQWCVSYDADAGDPDPADPDDGFNLEFSGDSEDVEPRANECDFTDSDQFKAGDYLEVTDDDDNGLTHSGDDETAYFRVWVMDHRSGGSDEIDNNSASRRFSIYIHD